MRKIAGLLTITALSLGSVAIVGATPQRITIVAKKGSNPPTGFTYVHQGSEIQPGMDRYKAQNHLSAAMNNRLIHEKKALGYNDGTIDTLPYFNGWFITGYRNSVYTYSMVGHSPKNGGMTGIDNRILPLIIELDDAKGHPMFTYDPTHVNDPAGSDVNLVLGSPLFDTTTNYNGDIGQIIDTNQRAEFPGIRTADWHTPLKATQLTNVYITRLRPTAWSFLVGPGGNVVGEAMDINVISNVFKQLLRRENANAGLPNSTVAIILTDYLSAYIPQQGGACCIVGFHNAESGLANPNGILAWTWATYIPQNNDIFAGFADITPLSHELTELYNDPFINTAVSAWADGSCSFGQLNLETGDVIEAMNPVDSIYPVTLNGYTYHPQNEATLQWFTRSPLENGTYSWPNINTLGRGGHPQSGCVYGEGPGAFLFQ
jgi:hypothetical protein